MVQWVSQELSRCRNEFTLGDPLHDYIGPHDLIMTDTANRHRVLQALLAAREIQRFVLEVEQTAASVPGVQGKKLQDLSPQIVDIRQALQKARARGVLPPENVGALQLGAIMKRLESLMNSSYWFGGPADGYQRLLKRYASLLEHLYIGHHPQILRYLLHIQRARESSDLSLKTESDVAPAGPRPDDLPFFE
jgi:hypothetical protein